jgi:molybdopterin-containing oxidoreductase family iron-sulfur binding subunit
MDNNKYWSSSEQLYEADSFKEKAQQELQSETPIFDYVENASSVENTGRRDFLKVLGFSVSAAAVATSCKIPVKKAVPYVFDNTKPIPEMVPGVADYYASTFYDGSDFANILVKTRENRPIKLEGNTKSPYTQGGTSAKLQASILSLYDTNRLNNPIAKGGKKISWQQADNSITAELSKIAESGGKIAIVSNSTASLFMAKAIEAFKSKYPTAVHVAYDPISAYAVRKANSVTLGSAIIPTYHYDKAKVIVGFNCDFLGTWLNPTENAKRYASIPISSYPYRYECRL